MFFLEKLHTARIGKTNSGGVKMYPDMIYLKKSITPLTSGSTPEMSHVLLKELSSSYDYIVD